ncbi:MAG: hypothetical protein WB988_00910, partial [Candidatus Nitrosopolaris sp.]
MNAMMQPIASNVKVILLSLIWFQVNMCAAPVVALQTTNSLIMNTRAGILVNLASATDPELA